ncbi:Hypothetical protein, putative [Bodo saltans]|uniref:Uncharacterized protein n=1 Tax=Bodo saltans TaxID=75058 RepID=A0A0S4J4Q2_BODSA|nr:Hypothetical protein, putative [Bodo saltans]|eukprot:CUG78022.1 Hypothetical protein, putative [Bodo saltans]
MTRSIALGAPSTHWCLPVTDDAAPLSSSPHQQQSRSGAPSTVASQTTTNHSNNESLVQCQLSPSGQVFAMLTQSRRGNGWGRVHAVSRKSHSPKASRERRYCCSMGGDPPCTNVSSKEESSTCFFFLLFFEIFSGLPSSALSQTFLKCRCVITASSFCDFVFLFTDGK